MCPRNLCVRVPCDQQIKCTRFANRMFELSAKRFNFKLARYTAGPLNIIYKKKRIRIIDLILFLLLLRVSFSFVQNNLFPHVQLNVDVGCFSVLCVYRAGMLNCVRVFV